MSFKVFFDLSVGVSKPITVPKGTIAKIKEHINFVETTLGFETEQYGDNPKHWSGTKPKGSTTDEAYCDVAEDHNGFVMRLYDNLARWSEKPVEDGEVLTPEESAKFWYGLCTIVVPVSRWTRDYYVARMEAFYDAMRGRESEGIVFEVESITPEQAAAVINLFASVIDAYDVRLAVPKGYDHLASFDDGGYEWCSKCGAVTFNHVDRCREEGCPARADLGLDNEEDED